MLLYCQVSKNPVNTKGFADLVLRKNAVWQKDLAIGRACFIQKSMLIELLMFYKISGNSVLHLKDIEVVRCMAYKLPQVGQKRL